MSDHDDCPLHGDNEPELVAALTEVVRDLPSTFTHIAEVLEDGEFWHASEDIKGVIGTLLNGPLPAMIALAVEHKQVPPDVQARLDQLEAEVRDSGDGEVEDVPTGGYI